jgi:poly [ADP-ribose] polymerase 2/3/4
VPTATRELPLDSASAIFLINFVPASRHPREPNSTPIVLTISANGPCFGAPFLIPHLFFAISQFHCSGVRFVTMPRKKAAVVAPSPPPVATPPPLDGCIIALSGIFPGQSHAILENYLVRIGAKIAKSVTKNVTHLITTVEDFDRGATKVTTAKSKGIPIVGLEWAQECERNSSQVSTDDFILGSQKNGTASKNGNATNDTAAANTSQNGTRHKRSDEDDDEELAVSEGPPAKKLKTSTRPKKSDDDDDGDDGDDYELVIGDVPQTKKQKSVSQSNGTDEKANKQKDPVAVGQIAKKNDILIPIDEACSLVNYAVYIDPDGVIYDATLNQTNVGRNNNKFYRLQVSHRLHIHMKKPTSQALLE